MNELQVINKPLTKRERKTAWQRDNRRKFADANGFSSTAHYAVGKIRKDVLARDNYSCVKCGMTDKQHKEKWSRPITIDHKDKNRKNNTNENLQTLCLSCHGAKDLTWYLKLQRGPVHKQEIVAMRKRGKTYQQIADDLEMNISTVWSWYKKWEMEGVCQTI
jgi:5-methylcytosine-specific restriction endonuclease McrA